MIRMNGIQDNSSLPIGSYATQWGAQASLGDSWKPVSLFVWVRLLIEIMGGKRI